MLFDVAWGACFVVLILLFYLSGSPKVQADYNVRHCELYVRGTGRRYVRHQSLLGMPAYGY